MTDIADAIASARDLYELRSAVDEALTAGEEFDSSSCKLFGGEPVDLIEDGNTLVLSWDTRRVLLLGYDATTSTWHTVLVARAEFASFPGARKGGAR